jgi:hypothetical protein
MPKLANKRSSETVAIRAITAQPPPPTNAASTNDQKEKAGRSSKQARVIAMLRSPAGATIAAVMKVTGWQQHSVRGFLAGVVRKKLRLKLVSKKADGNRIYRISDTGSARSSSRQPSRSST